MKTPISQDLAAQILEASGITKVHYPHNTFMDARVQLPDRTYLDYTEESGYTLVIPEGE